MKNRFWRRAAVAVMAAIALTGGFAGTQAAAASQSVSEAEKNKEQLQKNLEEAQELIGKLKKNKSGIEGTVRELDQKLTDISEQISSLEEKIGKTKKKIKKTQKELEKAKEDEQIQTDGMRLRIRFLYQNSGMGVLEALMSANSFADFLNSAEYISQIMDYDREMLGKYQATCEKIEKAKKALKQDEKDLEEAQDQMEEQKKAVSLLLGEKKNQLTSLQSELVDANEEAAAYKAKIAAENAIIAEIRAAEKRAKEMAAQKNAGSGGGSAPSNVNTSQSYTGGIFQWPCPDSRRITSGFGPRSSPTAGASSSHKGIDIGASYGASIVAAADGVVTVAGYQSAYGNYVTVSHGGGLYTMYCHCSSLVVSAGQKVSRGQAVARVGSTGISTGNHLHFAVIRNGVYVNPMNYL